MNSEIKKMRRLFLKKAGRAINTHSMISGGDRVAVAFSGGGDSIALLHALALRRAHIPVDYEISAVHVEVESVECGFDTVRAEKFCGSIGVSLHVVKADLPANINNSICAACALARRSALFRFCERNSCDKLALGHNLDDSVETLLMNMVFGSSISGISPSLNIFSGGLKIIRPLILMRKSEIETYLENIGAVVFTERCSHWKSNKREAVRKILRELEELSPGAARRIFNSMSNVKHEYLSCIDGTVPDETELQGRAIFNPPGVFK